MLANRARLTPKSTTARMASTGILLLSLAPLDARAGDTVALNAVAVPTSTLRVEENDVGGSRRLRIGRNKAVLIQFERELRDVMVSAPELLDVTLQSSQTVYLLGKDKVGQANAMFFDSTGQMILTLEVSIDRDPSELDEILRDVIQDSQIKVKIMNDTVLLSGHVPSPIAANLARDVAARYIAAPGEKDPPKSQVISMITVDGEEQVMLRVLVAEVQRSALKQFGVNLGATITAGNLSTTILTENALPLTAAQGLGTLPIASVDATSGILGMSGATNSGATTSWSSGGNKLTSALKAMERQGLVRTLAEPNLTAVSGESAKFLAGGEFPITTVDSDGNTSVTFKEYGVGLAFTPTVMSEGRISLKIETEVSELTSEGAVTLNSVSVSALKKREAISTVELPSGGSLALAGLIFKICKAEYRRLSRTQGRASLGYLVPKP